MTTRSKFLISWTDICTNTRLDLKPLVQSRSRLVWYVGFWCRPHWASWWVHRCDRPVFGNFAASCSPDQKVPFYLRSAEATRRSHRTVRLVQTCLDGSSWQNLSTAAPDSALVRKRWTVVCVLMFCFYYLFVWTRQILWSSLLWWSFISSGIKKLLNYVTRSVECIPPPRPNSPL